MLHQQKPEADGTFLVQGIILFTVFLNAALLGMSDRKMHKVRQNVFHRQRH